MFDALPSFNTVFESFNDPQRLHAMVVHIPIALTLLGFILTLGVTLTGSRASGLRWTTVFIFLIAALSAAGANYTGEESEEHLPIKPTGVAHELLEKHEQLAEYFWVCLAVTGTLILLSTVRVTWFRSTTLVLALLASIVSVGWVAAIGHYGGEMVYRHSVGVPSAGAPDHGSSSQNGDKDKKDKNGTKDADAKDKRDDGAKDGDTKDKIEPVKDATKDNATKDAAKDAKDKVEEKDKDKGERKLPEPTNKDKNIFDP